MLESDYTQSTNPVHRYGDHITNYNWCEDDKNANTLLLQKQVKIN